MKHVVKRTLKQKEFKRFPFLIIESIAVIAAESAVKYTDFINGGRTVKNWYLVMKTRRFRINN